MQVAFHSFMIFVINLVLGFVFYVNFLTINVSLCNINYITITINKSKCYKMEAFPMTYV